MLLPIVEPVVKKHRYGLADELGLPAKARLSDASGAVSEIYLVKPSWLYLDIQLKDPLTTIGPSHVKKSYTACNVLVLRAEHGCREVLLARRLTGYGRGEYALPGGKKKPRETAQECAKRELAEETGLRLIQASPISVTINQVSQLQTVNSIGVLAEAYVGTPVDKEREQMGPWEWFSLEAIPSDLFPPARWVIHDYLNPTRRFSWAEVEQLVAATDDPPPATPSYLGPDLWDSANL
jgi:ADP-ribose pyrophosphatase YjhB (NUDIX family)